MRICDRRNRTENISSHLKIIFYFGNSNNPWLLNAVVMMLFTIFQVYLGVKIQKYEYS